MVLLFGGLSLLRGGLAAADGELARIVVTRLSALILVGLAGRMAFIRVRSARRHAPNRNGEEAVADEVFLRDNNRRELRPLSRGGLLPLVRFLGGNPLAGALAVLAISAGMWATLMVVGLVAV